MEMNTTESEKTVWVLFFALNRIEFCVAESEVEIGMQQVS